MKKLSHKGCIFLVLNALFASASAAGNIDWNATAPVWPAGAFNNNYVNIGTPAINISGAVTGDTDDLNDCNTNTITTPSTIFFGGELTFCADFENGAESVTFTLTFSQAVSSLSFSVADVDQGSFQDQVTITANGPDGAVAPTITPDTVAPITYTVVGGNVIRGAAGDSNTFAPVTFGSAVTSVTMVYGNGPAVVGNPTQQFIFFSDLSWSNEADLVITKDDGSLTYTPGGTGTYVINVANNGPGPVTAAAIADTLPNGVTLSGAWSCSASVGSSCSAANGGSAGDSIVNLNADILNNGTITVTVPVNFSSNMGDY